MEFLKDKNILLGVTGSIAVYKALDILRLLVKAGANVRVVMSEDAKKFVTPLSFEALSANVVLHEETQSWADDNNHIHINSWADIFVIAPATANTINKLSSGIADNIITSIALAFTKQIVIAPAANTAMLFHKSTQNSLKKLQEYGYIVVDTQEKLLACNKKGAGALAEPETIFFTLSRELLKKTFWQDKTIIITGGGTIEKIDDVRYISNFSSGKMAEALCKAAYMLGSEVVYITTVKIENLPIKTVYVQSALDMQKKLKEVVAKENKKSFLFMAAAVSDFKPKNYTKGKIKKESIGEVWNLELDKNTDILKNIDKKNIKTVGFKAEVDKKISLLNAKNMLKDKNLDAVCLNIIDDITPFGADKNKIIFIEKNKETLFDLEEKFSLALKVISYCEKL